MSENLQIAILSGLFGLATATFSQFLAHLLDNKRHATRLREGTVSGSATQEYMKLPPARGKTKTAQSTSRKLPGPVVELLNRLPLAFLVASVMLVAFVLGNILPLFLLVVGVFILWRRGNRSKAVDLTIMTVMSFFMAVLVFLQQNESFF